MRLHTLKLFLILALCPIWAFAAQTQLKWHGHSAFEITTPKGKTILIDPWLNNPVNPIVLEKKDPVAEMLKVDYILLTHGHFDHVGDSVAIAKKTGAKLVTNFDLGNALAMGLGFPKDQMNFETLINIGGQISIADGEVTVNMVPAIHSSNVEVHEGGHNTVLPGGTAAGFVLKILNGPTIYDSGDTAYFRDMEVIGKQFQPDVALINIGGHFGMEPKVAAEAAYAVHAKLVIPHHFKTFPILTQSAGEFFSYLDKKHIKHLEMKPGQTIVFEGTKLKK